MPATANCTAHDEAFEIANTMEAQAIFDEWLALTLGDPSTDPEEQSARTSRAEALNQALTIQVEALDARRAPARNRARAGRKYQTCIEEHGTNVRRPVNIAELFEAKEDPALSFEPRPLYDGDQMVYFFRGVTQ